MSFACLVFAFLIFNFDKAKIFMGDAGAASIGFITSAFGFYGWSQDYWFFWFPLIISAPVIADTTLTLAKRIFHGHKFWVPHQNHLFQKLILMGNSHRKISIIYMYLTFVSGSIGIIANFYASSLFIVVLLIFQSLFLILCFFLFERRWALFDKSPKRFFDFIL